MAYLRVEQSLVLQSKHFIIPFSMYLATRMPALPCLCLFYVLFPLEPLLVSKLADSSYQFFQVQLGPGETAFLLKVGRIVGKNGAQEDGQVSGFSECLDSRQGRVLGFGQESVQEQVLAK